MFGAVRGCIRTACAFGGAALIGLAVSTMPAGAQKQTPKKSAPAAKAKAGEHKSEPQSAWVKLCEKAPIATMGKDGKQVKEEKNVCLIHHERLDGNTGMVLVSAAIRQIEDADKQHLMIMVPLGMAIHPGLRATVYTKELWDKAQKTQKVDDTSLEPIKLDYALCHPAGCTAEIEADKALIDKMKTGGGVMVLAVNAQGQVIAFPIPLTGFAQAFDGKPVDNKKYSEARKALMMQIAERQQQLMQDYKKKQAEKAGNGEQTPSAAKAAEKKK